MDYTAKMRNLMKKKGYNYKELAAACQVNYQKLWKCLTGWSAKPDPEIYDKVVGLLGDEVKPIIDGIYAGF